jgi:hypothetical protein
MRDNLVIAIPIQCFAWVILIGLLSSEAIWPHVLVPVVNNRPAFLTISIWLLQTLIVANGIGYLMHRLLHQRKLIQTEWKLSAHMVYSILHLMIIASLIMLVAGGEDL